VLEHFPDKWEPGGVENASNQEKLSSTFDAMCSDLTLVFPLSGNPRALGLLTQWM
jgi:hypothetical protein